jgi:hypothetical protein
VAVRKQESKEAAQIDASFPSAYISVARPSQIGDSRIVLVTLRGYLFLLVPPADERRLHGPRQAEQLNNRSQMGS